MLKRLIYRLLYYRHPWRGLDFDELSELYTSMMLRSLAISLVGIFVPVYLYDLGYGVTSILTFYAYFFSFRIVWDYIGGRIVARYGPKHSMIAAYILQVLALGMFVSLPVVGWPIVIMALLGSGANSIFFVAYHTDFSKIKHSEQGGKELGWMHIIERFGAMVGPLIGGGVATYFGARYAFVAAMVLFLCGLLPLFLSGEPVKTHQKLDFKDLDLGAIKRDLISYSALGIENSICLVVWPLFLALFIFSGDSYVRLGLVSSAAVIFSILSAHAIGQTIDRHRGRSLLRMAAISNAVLHIFRPLTGNLVGAIGVNVVNESVTVGYRIPFIKGMYDAADALPGRRIAYIVYMELFSSAAKAIFYWGLCLTSLLISDRSTMTVAFMAASAASLIIITEKFRALNVK